MEILAIALIFVSIAFLVVTLAKVLSLDKKLNDSNEIYAKLDALEKNMSRFESDLKNDFRYNREELSNSLGKFQLTFLDTLREISSFQLEQLKAMNELNQQNLSNLNKTIEERLTKLVDKNDQISKDNREAFDKSMTGFQQAFTNNVRDFNDLQKQKFADLEKKQGELITTTELKLEKMRETVDEKLQKTLETRLGQSFELVSKQLESVQKGLGEMQTLANDVGGLKRVLSNVKTRGVMGEIQLGNILEQILAPEQYEINVKTKRSSSDHVEFAIKLPGRDDNNQAVYLPVDAKFPQEAYHLLQLAYDEANPQKVEESTKVLAASITKFAKDISEKYLDPPFTTDFAIMFLPIEGLYAEVIRNTDLIEQLQRKFKVIVTGPTTLAAILNSLQMGFKTLAIQKRSSEVWQILGAVKTEFGKFGGILEKARKKIDEASNDIDNLVGTRTRAIERRLREVQELPTAEASFLLDDTSLQDDAAIESDEKNA
jgi:DNA recombination protein RmuC